MKKRRNKVDQIPDQGLAIPSTMPDPSRPRKSALLSIHSLDGISKSRSGTMQNLENRDHARILCRNRGTEEGDLTSSSMKFQTRKRSRDEDELGMTPSPHELATEPAQDPDYDKIDFPQDEIGEIRSTFCVQETWPRHLNTRS